jgi:hypothetical protein
MLFKIRSIGSLSGNPTYVPPDMTQVPAQVPGLDGYQFNTANSAWFKSMEKEGQRMIAAPVRAIPQAYMARALKTQVKQPAGLGTLKTMLSGRV